MGRGGPGYVPREGLGPLEAIRAIRGAGEGSGATDRAGGTGTAAGAGVVERAALRMLPKGTHDYDKFITPAELSQFVRQAGLQLDGMKGLGYNPLTKLYSLNDDTSVNYMVACSRPL